LVKIRDGVAQLNCQEAWRYVPQDASRSPDSERSEEEGEAKQSPGPTHHHLIISIIQTEEAEKDIERLRKVIDILKNYPGDDEVSFMVVIGDETTSLDMPHIAINYCPELASKLSNILGEGSLRLIEN